MAQQLGKAVEAATSPHQYALSTKAGCECIAHVLQGLSDADERTTLISVDGVSAFDLISRGAMMQGYESMAEVRQFRSSECFMALPSEYLWEDSHGVVQKTSHRPRRRTGRPIDATVICGGSALGPRSGERPTF